MPFALVSLYIAFVFIRPHEYIPFMKNIPILPVILIMAALTVFMDRRNEVKIPQQILIFLLPVMMLISNVFGGWPSKGIDVGLKFLPITLLYLLLIYSLTSIKRIKILMIIFIVSATIISIHGIDMLQHDGFGWTGAYAYLNRIRYPGIFNDPNDIGMFLVITLPFVIFFYKNSNSFIPKILYLTCIGILLYAIYLTNSRGSILGILSMVGFYMKNRIGIAKSVILGLLAMPLAVIMPSRMSEVASSDASAMGRLDAWYSGFHMFFSNPLSGIGAYRFTDYHIITAHNSYVLVLAEMGFLGFFIWGMFLFLSFYMLYKIRIHINNNSAIFGNNNVYEALNTAFYYSFIGMLFTIFFLSRSYTIILYIFIGLTNAYYIIFSKEYPELDNIITKDIWSRSLKWTVAGIIGLYFIVKLLLKVM